MLLCTGIFRVSHRERESKPEEKIKSHALY